MSSGIKGDWAELDATVAQLQGLSEVTERAARRAAPRLQAVARAQYAANRGPDGTPWKPNKDGSFPSLQRPASQITFEARGAAIVATAEDVLKYHQEGNPRLPRRPVFPDEDAPLPQPWADVLEQALREELEEK